ncbi:1,6-anhydro-N-acetylmuramyl-L-alanine amidase AmpD [Candidatus Symbiobacter mobilis]|uniref:1,6-anhydro-N-acetylmuramyl-L-alanine amidase AmpD n=1 Tax=Candidatus Symbiobacter mobilis CR TaxID=946483 RepID=U5N842_9BURK|nr:1,6-anhydro-N-acetylmuramyl-L-alanine amidase AmpD [Candidatus Symbiobacter mobilis]AGX86438.1 AmpD protein [Candidatus Symbiobacter mobilis CR]
MMPPDLPCGIDADGWHQEAQRVLSPNFGFRPAGAVIDLIVVHAISLPPGQYGGPEIVQLFCNDLDTTAHPSLEELRNLRVSSHFLIQRNGKLWQFVGCADRAWHAGASSYRQKFDCNNDSIGIELEGIVGDTFEDAQYAALTELCTLLCKRYPTIAYIAGHEHIAPGRKQDPGPGFDWERLRTLLGAVTLHFPQPLC